MQIDFHHAVTYVVARLAGFSHSKADIIAYCAQYVDDANNSGVIKFDNKSMYRRISSAHKMLDYRNLRELANHHVWIPFHFLPGNSGKPQGENDKASFINKIICVPDSFIAQDMIRACIEEQDELYGLHRLGVTMHVYADTWAHQQFAGVNDKVNEASHIQGSGGKTATKLRDKLANFFIGETFPLGHGAVLSYPDQPHLEWSYTNGNNKKIKRNNPLDFLEAADKMCQAMQRYQLSDPEAQVDGLPESDKKKIDRMLRTTREEDGHKRHEKWLKAIADGKFSFGPSRLTYIPKGKGSWKHKAIGTKEWVDGPEDRFAYKKSFLKSNWKCFHDALQAHRFAILHNILPKYGICAA